MKLTRKLTRPTALTTVCALSVAALLATASCSAPPGATAPAKPSGGFGAAASASTNTGVPSTPALNHRDLKALLAAHRKAGDFVGARIAFTDEHGTTTRAVAGTKGLKKSSPSVDLKAPWGIGSITKTFVAVVVLQLADEKRLDLDAPIVGYLPDLVDAEQISVRQLLQHTSGLGEYIDQPEVVAHPKQAWTPAELIAVAERGGRQGRPGAGFAYANTNYIVLGEIIEDITGASWYDSVRQRIIEPLGLSSTGFISPDSPRGFDLTDDGFVRAPRDHPSTGGAAGALESTPRDLLRFAVALGNGSLSSRRSWIQMRAFVPGEDFSEFSVVHSYGLGLERYRAGSLRILGHLGVSDAHSAFFGYDPRTGNAVAVQLNSSNGGPQAVLAVEALAAAAQAETQS